MNGTVLRTRMVGIMTSKFNPVALLTTDLHLSEKSEDQYRFDLFPWIIDTYGDQIKTVFITGDLTDRKNFHADWFVNKVVDCIRSLAKHFNVYILCGNHDYDVDPTQPFFGFLGKYKRVTYVSEPIVRGIMVDNKSVGVLFLPHTQNPGEDWSILNRSEMKLVDVIFMHQTFRGSVSESGRVLEGISSRRFQRFGCPIFSGDIHVPQQLGPITYIGCPYHIHYGDKFEPRVLLLNRKFETQDVQFPAPRKFMLDLSHGRELREIRREFRSGDRAKVRIHLPRSGFVHWPKHRDLVRKIAKKIGLQLHSVILKEYHDTNKNDNKRIKNVDKVRTHSETFDAFCNKYDIGNDISQTGSVFLEEE